MRNVDRRAQDSKALFFVTSKGVLEYAGDGSVCCSKKTKSDRPRWFWGRRKSRVGIARTKFDLFSTALIDNKVCFGI